MTSEWQKSSYSGSSNDACVEAKRLPAEVLVRDSKDTDIPAISVSRAAWTAFVTKL
ncbi:DUF397 domain-containing protein [Streptomyces daliensis]|uniref:DUF397 domain-containing protein n=1 Tax=Streptomyces daliensis TaxID=299421 RepID=A0A8T4J0G7_9ACTN|nr:DUF397 domain-containing protein [Streptomyces daliensis]